MSRIDTLMSLFGEPPEPNDPRKPHQADPQGATQEPITAPDGVLSNNQADDQAQSQAQSQAPKQDPPHLPTPAASSIESIGTTATGTQGSGTQASDTAASQASTNDPGQFRNAPITTPPGLDAWHRELMAEAASRSSVLWLRPSSTDRPKLLWHVWHKDAVHVLSGPGEQSLPSFAGPVEITVASKDDGSAVVAVRASGETVPPDSTAWHEAAHALAAARLNAQPPSGLMELWSQGCQITRFTPIQAIHAGPGGDDTDLEAHSAEPSGVTTRRRPWHWGGRSGRRRPIA